MARRSVEVEFSRSESLVLAPHPEGRNRSWPRWAKERKRPLAIDLFSGCGGLSLGLEQAGYSVVLSVDSDERAVETHRHNLAGIALDRDLSDPDQLDRIVSLLRGLDIDLVAGGPPCQPFSRAGRSKIRSLVEEGARAKEDERSDLWRSFLEVVRRVKPRAVLMENVPDMALGDDLRLVRTILDELSGISYASYLIALPAELLATIYGLYGARLLEQNVRTFLQARTKVNRGIIETIESSPEMFFAYNNGLTATASEITTKQLSDGTTSIESVKNLQIVNGGQTTASILYAKDKNGADLGNIYVQMKLSVIDPEDIEEIVPKISRYANTQNRISESDFFSSHPFHLEMERISRRLTAPQKAGAFSATKWFYERARGQYKDQLAYGTPAKRKRFLVEFPKNQVVVKTDIAKYVLSMEGEPHIVSQGAQKCFLNFAERVGKEWDADPDLFNEGYFKELVAKSILFRWTDSMIGKSEWYKEDRGYKANIVTYTIAWLSEYLASRSLAFDTRRIWERQDLSDELKLALEHCAPLIAVKIKAAPPEIKNISEYCKRPGCWTAVRGLDISVPGDLRKWTVNAREMRRRKKEERETKGLDNEIDFDARMLELQPQAKEIRAFAQAKRLLSPKASAAVDKLSRAKLNFTRADRNALKYLFERMAEAGFEFRA